MELSCNIINYSWILPQSVCRINTARRILGKLITENLLKTYDKKIDVITVIRWSGALSKQERL